MAVRVDDTAGDEFIQRAAELRLRLVDGVVGLAECVTSQDGAFVQQLTRVGRSVLALIHQAGAAGVQTGHGAAGRTHPTTRHRPSGRRVQGLPVVQILGEGLVAQAVHGTLADQILCKFRASFGDSTRPHAGRDGPADTGLPQPLGQPKHRTTHHTRHNGLQGRLEGPRDPSGVLDLLVSLGGPDGGVHHGLADGLVGHLVVAGRPRTDTCPNLGTPDAPGGQAADGPTHHRAGRGREGRAHTGSQSTHAPLDRTTQVLDVTGPLHAG